MDRFSQRASVLLGYSPQSSFVNHSSSSKTPFGDSDVDFNDVFGGPPRRSSIYERCSFSGTTDSSSSFSGDSEGPRFRSPWSGLSEKPVFGEEILIRRRYPSDDFYDDIFRSDESVSSTPPRNGCRDPFASSPGSRVLSPVRPLPPKSEPFVSSSLPAQFSLPPTLTKGMDIQTFCSAKRSVYNNKDGASNGIICSHSPNTSLSSRFPSQGIQCPEEELKNDVRSQSSLSNEFSLSSERSSCLTESDKIDTGGNLKKDSNGIEVTIDSNKFHFSIYKWASKGIPFSTRLNGKNGSRLKQMGKAERCLSTNGRIECEKLPEELSMRTPCNTDFPSSANIAANSKSSRMEHAEQENNSHLDTRYRLEPCRIVEETVFPILESETLSRLQDTVEDVPEQTLLCTTRETPSHLLPKIVSSENSSVATQEAEKPELKSLRSLLYDNDDEQGCVEKARKVGGEEIKVSSAKKSSDNVDVVKNVEKLDGKSTLNNAEDRKAGLQGSPMISQDKPERNRGKGKIKEFVKIFDQEASSKEKLDVDSRNLSSRWKERSSFRRESFRATKTNEKIYTPDMNKTTTLTDPCITADDDIKKSEEQQSTAAHYIFSDAYLELKDSSGSGTASISDGFEATVVNTDEFFQGDFLVKELPQDENKLPELHQDKNKLPPIGEDPEDIQVADAKIRKWSKGKEGNIRSLLSTLQYVLWPESGWKPEPLVDIIEGNKVKRAYQKALLCLHPDKLQQKGAALHKKYIAEKVFDILQEAWTHFNTLSSL